MLRDLSYAFRTLRKSPVFFITAAGTIALGIGASTAIFSVTNAVLLQPLPYKDPDRLVLACGDMRKRNVKDFPWSNAEFFDFRDAAKESFEDFAVVRTGRATIPRDDATSMQVRVAAISPNFFRMMGGRVTLGRDFNEGDGTPQPAPPANQAAGAPAPPRLPVAAVLSYDFYQRRYGANPSVLGRTIFPNGPTIVGVLAPGFELMFPPDASVEQSPDYWTAARMGYDAANRNNVQWRVIGRLKPGVTLERAQSEADAASLVEQQRDNIARTADFHARLEPMQAHMVAAVRPAILALMGAVVFLLLIACANVANLMLVRVSLRERELAVRTAMGGSWFRLIRQMVVESMLLAGVGTVLGVALAAFGIYELRQIAPANLPRLDSIRLDPGVLLFSVLAGVGAAALFGILPALRTARPDVITVLRASGRSSNLSGARVLRNSVVVLEVALSFVLLIGSGLMYRSFVALQHIDPGFDTGHLLTFQVLAPGGRPNAQQGAEQRALQTRLASLPGVQSATASFPFPLTGNFTPIRWGMEPALSDPSKFLAVDWQVVLPGYFQAMRTPILDGREFTDADSAPNRNLVIVDKVLAEKAFPHQSAVGKRILSRIITPEAQWYEIIGVAAHQRQSSLADAGREQIYFVDGYFGNGVANRWAVRTSGNPAQYANQVRAEIARINSKMLVTEVEPMDEIVDKAQAGTRFSLLLIGVFAIVAALLAAVGLYGVLSTVVRQRTAEIGVRMALGAAPGSIFHLVVGQGLRLSAAGIVVGLLAALALTRVMTTMLVGVKATDPLTYVAMAVLFFAIAALACWMPAWRAAGLDPTTALRDE